MRASDLARGKLLRRLARLAEASAAKKGIDTFKFRMLALVAVLLASHFIGSLVIITTMSKSEAAVDVSGRSSPLGSACTLQNVHSLYQC